MNYQIRDGIPFGYGMPTNAGQVKKAAYTWSELKETAACCRCSIRRVEYKFGYIYYISNAHLTIERFAEDERAAHRMMHQFADEHAARFPPLKPSTFKILVMTEEGRCIDETQQVCAADTYRPEFDSAVVTWLRRTLRAGHDMQRDGRINGMPKLRKCEGARESLFALRKRLYQATHTPFAAHDRLDIWSSVESLLEIAEENLK